MARKIDLHIHSNISDGALTPKEIIDEASKNGVDTIAIADHDIIDAYTNELYEYAKEKNIQIINAIEISTKTKKAGIHILGYNFDVNNETLKEKLSKSKNARHDYLYNVAKKLSELGYKLNIEELDKIEAVTKAHISNDIINNKENHQTLLKEFGHIPNKGEFIETIMNEGCPGYVKKESITPKAAADIIRKAGGKVVIAHPVAYRYEDNLTEEDIQEIIDEVKPDGIEAYYIYIDRNNTKINEISIWNKLAKENNLISTIGSDFHNKDDIHSLIGLINENLCIPEEEIEKIIENILN